MAKLNNAMPDVVSLPADQGEWMINRPYEFQGLAIVLEYLSGDIRIKARSGGRTVKNIMPTAYGEILRTTDQHGEPIDIYLNNNPSPDATIYVIDQVCSGTGLFDEHKVMLGFESVQQVIDTYYSVFADGSGKARLGAVVAFPNTTFYDWLDSNGFSLEPASKYDDGTEITVLAGIRPPPPTAKMMPRPLDETGGVIVALPDVSAGPKVRMSPNPDGGIEYTFELASVLKEDVWSNAIDTFIRTLNFATDKDVMHIRIDSPGGSVFLMGRIVSAIKTTNAKVITYAQGRVCSAATTVWAAGHERHIRPSSYFMQHMSSQMLQGKTTDIKAKSIFVADYIDRQLDRLIEIGLFTKQEVIDMAEKSSDIFISGREAIARVGEVSYSN